ncbi:MAG: hypothetical protein JNM59_08815 [Hyphomonadaceae bacterium]|nr:hypothetical protein [Hyphomonadaceae bacterium]
MRGPHIAIVVFLLGVCACESSQVTSAHGVQYFGSDAQPVDCSAQSWGEAFFGDRPRLEIARETVAMQISARTQWARSNHEQRLVALQDTMDSILASASWEGWRLTQARARATFAQYKRRADAINDEAPDALLRRLQLWTELRAELDEMWSSNRVSDAGALDCLAAPHLRSVRLALGASLADLVAAPRQLSEDELIQLTQLHPTLFEPTSGLALCQQLTRSLAVDLGRAAYARHKLNCAIEPLDEAAAVTNFESDWANVRAFLLGRSTANFNHALRMRAELDQFARWAGQAFALRFPRAAQSSQERVWALISATDIENATWLERELSDQRWVDDAVDGPGAEGSAWIIVQHADANVEFQRRILLRMQANIATPGFNRSQFAMLFDRVAVNTGTPQRFGSQLSCDGAVRVIAGAIEDPAQLDARRANYDLEPWEAYRAIVDRIAGPCMATGR